MMWTAMSQFVKRKTGDSIPIAPTTASATREGRACLHATTSAEATKKAGQKSPYSSGESRSRRQS